MASELFLFALISMITKLTILQNQNKHFYNVFSKVNIKIHFHHSQQSGMIRENFRNSVLRSVGKSNTKSHNTPSPILCQGTT